MAMAWPVPHRGTGPLSQHFLISTAARTQSLRDIIRMTDEAAHARFVAIRFAVNNGEPFCPHCGTLRVYALAETPMRWKCSSCRRKFSVTSGTIFHSRKLSIRDYLAAIALFCNGVKGVAALRMARDMNINPKSASQEGTRGGRATACRLGRFDDAAACVVDALAGAIGGGSTIEVASLARPRQSTGQFYPDRRDRAWGWRRRGDSDATPEARFPGRRKVQ
jgi:transposase-like protein